jgi:hypothetical protein
MKTWNLIFLLLIGLSSCIVEVDLNPPFIEVGNIDEYETKEVIHETWVNGVLVYEEAIYHTWLEIDFRNTGGVKAYNVQAEIAFFNGNREIQTININLPDIRSGNTYVYTLETGFNSIYDYSDYDVHVYWE